MTTYDYLIIGGGMTAAAAIGGIRSVDPSGSIGLISREHHRPYNRPPLSKKLWQGKPEDSIWRELDPQRLDLMLGCRVVRLDPGRKAVQNEAGNSYTYRRLLLATGGSPRRLPFAPAETVYFRTLDDYRTVRGWAGQGQRIGVIGGGFIGSEVAAALASNGAAPVMVFPESGIGARIYPADLSDYLTRFYQQQGVEIHSGLEIQAVERRNGGREGGQFVLQGKDGRSVAVDHLIAGIGIHPNTDLAQAAGIAIGGPEAGGGILVDGYLQTDQPDIFAAGDVASFPSPALGKTLRVEHADNADSMGQVAGLNMAGRQTVYDHLPYFYSDLFDLGYEAVGELDARLQVAAEWQEPFRKGVLYYLKDGRVRGVLLWNTWDQVEPARQLVRAGRVYQPGLLKQVD